MRLILMCLMLTFVTAQAADKLPIAKGGKSDYAIVVRQDASPSEKRGANEIQKFVEEMSGAKLPIVTEDQPAKEHEIVVGIGSRAAEAKLQPDVKSLGNDGFVLNTRGQKLFILGSPVRGTMYGCSEVL